MQADTFSLDLGSVRLRVASEAPELRARVAEVLAVEPGERPWRDGLLVARPAADGAVGTGLWVVYESGSIVLRRTRNVDEAVSAACYHLAALAAAAESTYLPVRLRTVLLPSGDALLVEPEAVSEVAGHDRRLSAKGALMLPTTVAVIDPTTRELVLCEQTADPSIPSGRRPLAEILVPSRGEDSLEAARPLLALTRTALRDGTRDLQSVLDQLDLLVQHRGLVRLVERDEIAAHVTGLGRGSTG